MIQVACGGTHTHYELQSAAEMNGEVTSEHPPPPPPLFLLNISTHSCAHFHIWYLISL